MQLSELGVGYVFMFKLATLVIALTTVLCVINLPKIIRNIGGSGCTTTAISSEYLSRRMPPCTIHWTNIHSQANYGLYNYDPVEQYLLVFYFCFLFFSLGLMSVYLDMAAQTIQKTKDSPADWTLMVKGLNGDLTEQQISELGNYIAGGKVRRVCLAYNLHPLQMLLEEVKNAKIEIRKAQQEQQTLRSTLPEEPSVRTSRILLSTENLSLLQFIFDKKNKINAKMDRLSQVRDKVVMKII